MNNSISPSQYPNFHKMCYYSRDVTLAGVIFDLDGTLVDNTTILLRSYENAFQKLGLNYPGDKKLLATFGRSLAEILDILNIPEPLKLAFTKYYQKSVYSSQNMKLVDGMDEVLKWLTSIKIPLAIVTSKSRESTMDALSKAGITNIFAHVITADDSDKHKPHPVPILLACEGMDLQPSHSIVYIGDSIHDMRSALSAGVLAVGVAWGVHKVIISS